MSPATELANTVLKLPESAVYCAVSRLHNTAKANAPHGEGFQPFMCKKNIPTP